MLRSLDTELKRKLFGTISAEISPREQIVWKEAGCLISITPLLIVYVFLQKHFIEGIERSGIVG
jgi:multiple sugar transport system permease protein